MPKIMSDEKSAIVVDALKRGMSRGEISGVCGISKRAITRIHTSLKKHGSAKPPPSGIKLGRPVKLTKVQADAMIVWMAKEDHTFYVKDLVAFLREQYRFKGCDGTIRRCLMRAGYRRNLPWHKSEKTVWVPPEHKPTFETTSAKHRRASSRKSPSSDDPSESGESEHDEEAPATDGAANPSSRNQQQPSSIEASRAPERPPTLSQHCSVPDPAHHHQLVQTPFRPPYHEQGAQNAYGNNQSQYIDFQQHQHHPYHQSTVTSSVPHGPPPDHTLRQPMYTPVAGFQAFPKSQAPQSLPYDSEARQFLAFQQEIAEKNAMIAHLQRQVASYHQHSPAPDAQTQFEQQQYTFEPSVPRPCYDSHARYQPIRAQDIASATAAPTNHEMPQYHMQSHYR